jgi:ribosome-associated heat shock protein Hsp15
VTSLLDDRTARLDKWLWAVRIFKTRALAAAIVGGKSARITRGGQTMRTDKPGFKIRLGDTVTIMRGRELFVLEVRDLPEKRLPASEAVLCYENQAATDEEPRHA